MNTLDKIRNANPHIEIHDIHSEVFRTYGKVLNDFDGTTLIEISLKAIQMPDKGSKYLPELEEIDIHPHGNVLRNEFYGQLNAQIGICLGHNSLMNAMEYHKSSEINIAVTDLVLLLADQREMDDNYRFNSEKVKAFFMKKGDTVEIFSTTLHFCPCEVNDGFSCIVVLPRDTNKPLDREVIDIKDELLFAKNKWLIAHEYNETLINRGVKANIYGENWKINPIGKKEYKYED